MPTYQKTRGILWFRSDLRLEDNEALTESLEACDEILPVYIFDDRLFDRKTSYGFRRTGKVRRHFIEESVVELQSQLESKYNARLIVCSGITEDIIYNLAYQLKTRWVFCNRERTRDEVEVQDAVEKRLWTIGQEMRYSRGKMLLYTADLPFPVTHTPDRFSIFRREVSWLPVREPLPVPGHVPVIEGDFEIEEVHLSDTRVEQGEWHGGVREGQKALRRLIESLKDGKDKGSTACLSPWLAHGCLSPKEIYHKINRDIKDFDEERFEDHTRKLLRRDHLRFIAKKYGNKIFHRGGVRSLSINKDRDDDIIAQWCEGQTGEPIVDAAMHALNSTGYINYRMRVLVSSFLIYQLRQDWLVGAEYFESRLIDYDPCSNYGNWSRIAGAGATARETGPLNLEHQTNILDPDGTFVDKWLGSS